MRNLKKILALVLALVMSLSLMATAGAADAAASNSETITAGYQTAVDVLKGVKVFNGYSDGTFKPQQTITRAEVAAILYRIATGDVTDAKKDIYTDMANVNFTDLAGANWAKGYINYCSNAELIVGMGDGTFRPSQPISGYATLAMILRALGYDQNNEFKGSGWELRTASKARELGILNNVTGDLGSYATREMVAEILFRAILNETVTYSPMNQNGYQKTGTTLAKQNLSLEEVEGVVVANEYANLDAATTLATDKTKLDTHAALLDYHTTLDDIGESRLAYIHKGSTVLSIADTGKNNTAESTADLSKLDSLKTEAGISGNAEGENYVNFDKYDQCDSDYRIKYVLNSNEGLLLGGMTTAEVRDLINAAGSGNRKVATLSADETAVEVVLTPGTPITKVDRDYMRAIFGKADKTAEGANIYVDGEVYVGTQSVKDISDDYNYSYEKFEDEFIDFDTVATVSANERGNWVKVIDNDGDGVTDYIFKVVYTVAQIAAVKDDTYTLDTKNHVLFDHHPDADTKIENYFNNVTSEKVVATNGETFAKGDVVYYAVIDDKAQTVKCDTVTAQIEKVDHNKLIATTTDGTEYTESQVCEHIEDEAYEARVRNLSGKVSYELYFDRGGYLAAFVKTDKVGDFQLITDGWYDRLKVNEEYAVRVYNDETGKQDIVDITANGSLFIGSNNGTLNNNWGALKVLGANGVLNYNGEKDAVRTAVAAITADGTILPVENSAVTGRYEHAMIDMVKADGTFNIPLRAAALGDVHYTSNGAYTAYNTLDADETQVPVRALDNTIYYVVYPDRTMESGVQVLSYTGYSSGIESAFKSWVNKGYVEDVYAVGTAHKADNDRGTDYYTADVVVIELNHYDQAGRLVLVVDDTARFSDVTLRDVQIIDNDGELKTVTVNWRGVTLSYSDNRDHHKQIPPGLYYLYDTSDDNIYRLGNTKDEYKPLNATEIREAGCIATGYVKQHEWLANNKYVVVEKWAYDGTPTGNTLKEGQYDLSDETPLYTLAYNDTTWVEYTPTITKVDHDTALAGRVNETRDASLQREASRVVNHNTTYYNYNDVMVFYNSKGAAVYAVSFENIYKDGTPKNYVEDYAQRLWEIVTPAAADTSRIVEFYGVEDGEVRNDVAVDIDPAAHSIEVPYDVAWNWHIEDSKNAVKADALYVKGASDWFVTDKDNDVEDLRKAVPHEPVKSGKTYQLNVLWNGTTAWEIWTLKIGAADDDNTLYFDGELVSTDANNRTVYDGTVTTLANVKEKFTKAANADWTWTVTDADGRPVEDVTDQTIWGDGFKATVVVTAQNGTAKTYYVEFVAGTAVAPTQAERDAAQDEVDAYTPAGIDKVDAAALQAAKDDAAKAIANARTKKALDNAVAAYKAAVDKLIADLPVVEDDVKCAEFENNTKTPFEYTALDGTRVSIPLTVPTGLELVDGKVTVAAGKDGIPAADKITNPGNGDHIVLMIVKNKGTFAEADAADVVTNDLYAETGASITVEAAEGDTLYFYYYMEPGQGGGDDPENPDNPGTDDPVTPPSGGGDISELPPIIELAPVSGRMQTLALDDPAAGEKSGVIWVLVRNDLTPEIGDTSAYKEVKGPFNWTGAEGQEVPSAGVKAKYEQYKEYYNLYYVTYTYEGNVTTTPALAPKEVAIVLNNSIKGAATTENTAVKPGDTVTVTAKDGYVIKEAKVGTTALTVAEDGKTATYTVPADATGTITIDVTIEKAAEGDVTIKLTGNKAMVLPATATGTEKEITFEIVMNDPAYAPVLDKVLNATGTENGVWDKANNVELKLGEDGKTWTATVANAAKDMTLVFVAELRGVITVKPNGDEAIAAITNIKPEKVYTDGECVFTFDVTNGKVPTVKTDGGVQTPVAAANCTFVKGDKLNTATQTYTWTLTVKNVDTTKTVYLAVDDETVASIKVASDALLDSAYKKNLNLTIVDGKVSFEVKTTNANIIPKVTSGTWTYSYDEDTGLWTVSGTSVSGAPGTTYTLGTVAEQPITIKCGDGIAKADRTVIYPSEIPTAGIKFAIEIADGYIMKEAIEDGKVTCAKNEKGVVEVTIKSDATKTNNTITLSATKDPAPTLTAKTGAKGLYLPNGSLKGEYNKTKAETTFVISADVIDDNYAIKVADIQKSGTDTAVAGTKVTRGTNGDWTIVVPYTDAVGDKYTVNTTELFKVTLEKADTNDTGIVIDKATSDYVYDVTSSGKIALQFKVEKGMTPTVKKGETTIETVVCNEALSAKDEVYDVYDVTLPNNQTENVTLKVSVARSTAYTVTLNKSGSGNWFVDQASVKTSTGVASFTVSMADGLFPKAKQTTSPAVDGVDFVYDGKPTVKDGMNVWTIQVTGVTADVEVTISAIEEAFVVSASSTDKMDVLGKKALANGSFDISEKLLSDGTHEVTITGVGVGNFVDKNWFTADIASKKSTDLFDGFYGSGQDPATWAWFSEQEGLADNERAALVGYFLPGLLGTVIDTAGTGKDKGCSCTSFAGDSGVNTFNWDDATEIGEDGVAYVVKISVTIDGLRMAHNTDVIKGYVAPTP